MVMQSSTVKYQYFVMPIFITCQCIVACHVQHEYKVKESKAQAAHWLVDKRKFRHHPLVIYLEHVSFPPRLQDKKGNGLLHWFEQDLVSYMVRPTSVFEMPACQVAASSGHLTASLSEVLDISCL